jgi:hypothetical protein
MRVGAPEAPTTEPKRVIAPMSLRQSNLELTWLPAPS